MAAFLLTAEFLFLNVMHSLSLLPNNCPKDQQPDEREHFISLLDASITGKKQPPGLAPGHGGKPLSVQLLEPTEPSRGASGAAQKAKGPF